MKTIRALVALMLIAACFFFVSASFALPCQNCGGGDSSATDGPMPIPPGGTAFQACVTNCLIGGGKYAACRLICTSEMPTFDPILSY